MKRPTPPCDHSGAPIPCQFDLRRLVKPRIDKRGRLLDGFEPLSAATQESTHRVKLLRQAQDPEAQALAAALEQCRRARRCGSRACPVCGRLRRIRTSASILRFLAAYPLQDLRYLTLINPADALPAGHLRTFDPKKLVNRFRRQFERAGIDKSKSFIVAQLDGEWDEGRDRYPASPPWRCLGCRSKGSDDAGRKVAASKTGPQPKAP